MADSESSSAFDSMYFGKEYEMKVKAAVGAMSISPCGRDVVLASRQGLHIIDLDSPHAAPWHLPHYTPWEVADVQWSPFAMRDYWVVSTSNQKALVWNLMMSDVRSAVQHYLHAHTRAITDINFSAHHPDILATCAVDSFVHCWDLRHPVRPALSFADWFAGATQVKWNRQDPHVVASSHDRILRIWDDRNGAHPLHSIEAHDTKIYGLDWNRVRTTALITCSLDKSIKFWDYSVDTQNPERIIETSFPIWRARHTPFGHGVLAMPQRDDNNLYLYDRRPSTATRDISSPVKAFPGHVDQVKEFVWRCRGNIDADGMDNREFQLVTWGADHFLRLHPMEDTALAQVGYVKGRKSHGRLHLTRSNADYKTFQTSRATSELKTVKSSSSIQEQPSTTSFFDVAKSGMSLRGRSAAVSEDFLNAKNNPRSMTALQKDLDPISWMKGVRVGKAELHPNQGIESGDIADPRSHRGSEEFESLGEEVTHVGDKFANIEFGPVHIDQRYIRFSTYTTLGKESSTYLACEMRFPAGYPMSSAPEVTLEKTALWEEDTLLEIESCVQKIGNAYLEHQKNSLEAIIRYLHGDYSIEDALARTTKELEIHVEESSSDEDDAGQLGPDHESEFGLADSGIFGQSNVNAYMPLAKACAGVWSPNGSLVCFFPPKAKSTRLDLGSHERHDFSKTRRKGLFRPFKRLIGSGHNRSKERSQSSLNDRDSSSESESSESEYSSSPSSTSSSEADSNEMGTVMQHVFNLDYFKYRTGRAPDETLQSADSLNGSTFLKPLPKSIITIYDLREILPAKEELAKEYVCSGPGVCQNNAAVALKHGCSAIADVWKLLDLVLRDQFVAYSKGVSVSQSLPKGPVSQIQTKKGGNSINNLYDDKLLQIVDIVKWSSHPFGGRLLVKRLFEYYAGMADVQMLAMMSYVLLERDQSLASIAVKKSSTSGHEVFAANGKFNSQESFSVANHSKNMISESPEFKRRASSLRSPMKASQDAALLSSSYETVVNNSSSLDSSGPETALNRSFDAQTPTSKLSSSPEWTRPLQRTGTNLANAIMAFPLPFSMTTSAASSPPTASYMKKKVSSIGVSSITGGSKVANPSASGVVLSRLNSTKPSDGRLHVSRQQSATVAARGMTFKLKSNHIAYQEETRNEPLLDPAMTTLYQTWRDEYAELLLSWGLLIPHAEMRKNNGPAAYNLSQAANIYDQSSAGDQGAILPLTHCRFCDDTSPLDSSESTCQKCYQSCTTICALCNLQVYGRSSPCFVCGHILHTSCREIWEYHFVGTSCPTGCGCVCSSPVIPLEGVVKYYNDEASQTVSPQSSRFTSSYLSTPYLRSSSPAASTIRNYPYPSSRDHHTSLPGALHSTPTTAGARTPRDSNVQTNHHVAYATLQSLAAHSRPRGDTTGTRQNSTSDKAPKSAKLRASKSLMFATAFGGSGSGSSSNNTSNNNAPVSSESKKTKASSSASAARTASSASNSVYGKSRRSSMAKTAASANGGGNSKKDRSGTGAEAMQHEEFSFDWGFGETDDSDVEGE